MNMGKGEYSQETIESSQKNEWGIPDSQTLEPFSSSPQEQLSNGGRITLVGSGPGDPDLLTVKAMKLLQDPDALVICDRLVSEEIVNLVKGEVKVARKLPGCAELAQEEIYWLAHQGLAQGKHVIRLKIGDPFVFGRGGEEVLTFRRFGVESKVVPVSQSVTEKRTRKRRNDFFFSRQQILITNFFCVAGCFGRLFGSLVGEYSRHTPRGFQPSRHVHRIRSGGHLSGFDPIPQRTDRCLFNVCRPAARIVWKIGTSSGIS